MRSRLSAEVISKNGNGAHTVLAYPFWLICWQKPTANILLSQILDCNYTWKKIRDFHVYTTKTLEWEYIFENGLWQQKTSANSVGHFEYFFTVLYKQLGLAYIICLSDFLANLTTGSLSSKLVSPALFRRKPRYEKLCSASYWLSQTVETGYIKSSVHVCLWAVKTNSSSSVDPNMHDIEQGEIKTTIHQQEFDSRPTETKDINSSGSIKSSRKLSYFVKGCMFLIIVAIVVALATLPNIIRDHNDGQGIIANTGSDGLFPSTTVFPAPTATPDPRLSRSFYGIDYTPHGAQAQFQCGISQQQVNQDLQVLQQLTSRIRLYGMDCDQASLVMEGIKQLKLDMGVLLTLWVDGNQTTYERQYKIFWDVVRKYGGDHILGVSVGNEGKSFRREQVIISSWTYTVNCSNL